MFCSFQTELGGLAMNGVLTMNGENICLGCRQSPAVCFAHLLNLLCGSLLAIVLAFIPV